MTFLNFGVAALPPLQWCNVTPVGIMHYRPKCDNFHYYWNKPVTTIHNLIFGELWADHVSKVLIHFGIYSQCVLTSLASPDCFHLHLYSACVGEKGSGCTRLCTHIMYSQYVLTVCTHIMYSQYVLKVCTHSMYSQYVLAVCTRSMYSHYVLTVCTHSMYSQYVLTLCTHSMYSQYVCTHSMYSQYVCTHSMYVCVYVRR